MGLFKRGTAATATANNKILAAGEPGVTTDTHQLKVGDGSTPWSSLPEVGSSTYGRKNVLDVTDPAYGTPALIDGSTDNTAVISAVALLAATRGGGRVYIPGYGPNHKCKVSQLPLYANVKYIGDGPGATWLSGTDPTKSVFVVNEALGTVYAHGVEDLDRKSTRLNSSH